MPNSNSRISTSLHNFPLHPLSGVERALALQDPHSFEYKQLMHALEVAVDKHDVLTLMLCNLIRATEQEKKDFESQREKRIMLEEARLKQQLEITREQDERILEQGKNAERHQHSPILEVEKLLERYQELKQTIDDSIRDIEDREQSWKDSFKASADDFIKNNFKLRDDGRLVAAHDESVVFKRDAINIIRHIMADVKSPTEILVHNPGLMHEVNSNKDGASVMMHAQQNHKQLHLVRKLDKVLDPESKEHLHKKLNDGQRKIITKQYVIDENGNRVVRKVALEPHKKIHDPNATDESTKKNKQYTLTVDNVNIANHAIPSMTCSAKQIEDAQELINLAPQKRALLEARAQCQANIDMLNNRLQAHASDVVANREEARPAHQSPTPFKNRPEPK